MVNTANNFSVGLDNDQFLAIKELIYKVAGITLQDHKRQMVSNRIAKRIKALSLTGYDDYISYLDVKGNLQTEIPDLVNVLTTNVTHFFREEHHFQHLKTLIVNNLQKSPEKKFRIWCAGCSSGQEPYSAAITCIEAINEVKRKGNIKILATDIDTTVLEKARQGIYTLEQVKGISPERLKKHFFTSQKANGLYMVKPELRNLIAFNHLNLNIETWPMKGSFNVIFCRNVLIYFNKDKQRAIVNKMASHLERGNFLYLGHSEHYAGASEKFKSLGHTIYEYNGD